MTVEEIREKLGHMVDVALDRGLTDADIRFYLIRCVASLADATMHLDSDEERLAILSTDDFTRLGNWLAPYIDEAVERIKGGKK